MEHVYFAGKLFVDPAMDSQKVNGIDPVTFATARGKKRLNLKGTNREFDASLATDSVSNLDVGYVGTKKGAHRKGQDDDCPAKKHVNFDDCINQDSLNNVGTSEHGAE